jgi:hypothetical protein
MTRGATHWCYRWLWCWIVWLGAQRRRPGDERCSEGAAWVDKSMESMDKSIEYYRWLEYVLVWLFTHLSIFRGIHGIHEVFCNTWPNDTSTETMLWSLEAPSVLPGGHGFPMDLPEKVPAILRALAVSNGRLSAWPGKLRCSKVKFTFQTDTSSQKYEVGQVSRVALMPKNHEVQAIPGVFTRLSTKFSSSPNFYSFNAYGISPRFPPNIFRSGKFPEKHAIPRSARRTSRWPMIWWSPTANPFGCFKRKRRNLGMNLRGNRDGNSSVNWGL